jgi:hypothetical protein
MRHLVSSSYMLDKYTFECFTLFHVSQTNFVQVEIPVNLRIPVPIMTLKGYKKWRGRSSIFDRRIVNPL